MALRIIGYIAAVIFMIAFVFIAWHVARQWNYKLGYEAMVQKTVCDMVKPEYLKKEC